MRLGLPAGQGEGGRGSPTAPGNGEAKMGWHDDSFGRRGSSDGGQRAATDPAAPRIEGEREARVQLNESQSEQGAHRAGRSAVTAALKPSNGGGLQRWGWTQGLWAHRGRRR
jgi:hypothetical protein